MIETMKEVGKSIGSEYLDKQIGGICVITGIGVLFIFIPAYCATASSIKVAQVISLIPLSIILCVGGMRAIRGKRRKGNVEEKAK